MATNSATETMQQQHIQCKHTTHNLDHQAHARGCMFVLSQMRVAATGQRVHMTGLHVADRNALGMIRIPYPMGKRPWGKTAFPPHKKPHISHAVGHVQKN